MIDTISATQPRTSSLSGAVAGGEMGKEEFLQLLVTQLRYQDPMNPSAPEDFAAQLAQFSSLEQLIQIKDGMVVQAGTAAQLAENINASAALGVLGKEVMATGDNLMVDAEGNSSTTIGVGGSGGAATVYILRKDGTEIASGDLGFLRGGRNDIDLSEFTDGLAAGAYRYRVEVADGTGELADVKLYTVAMIDGLRYTPQGPLLIADGVEIPIANVIEINSQNEQKEGK